MTSQNVIAVVLGLLTMLGGGGVTWLVSRRKSSGRINTTEAETLWSESQKMRQELRDEVASLRIEAGNMRSDNDRLESELASAHSRMAEFGLKLVAAEEKIADYEREINRLLSLLPDERQRYDEVVKNVRAATRVDRAVRKKT